MSWSIINSNDNLMLLLVFRIFHASTIADNAGDTWSKTVTLVCDCWCDWECSTWECNTPARNVSMAMQQARFGRRPSHCVKRLSEEECAWCSNPSSRTATLFPRNGRRPNNKIMNDVKKTSATFLNDSKWCNNETYCIFHASKSQTTPARHDRRCVFRIAAN